MQITDFIFWTAPKLLSFKSFVTVFYNFFFAFDSSALASYFSLLLNFFPSLRGTNFHIRSDQIRSLPQSCPTLCDPMNRSTPGLPVHHQLLEFTETHVHRVSDAIQPSHPLSSSSPLVPNPSQHQSHFQ